jgi:hypothetical protein
MKTFVTITLDEMESFLTPQNGWELQQTGNEYLFEYKLRSNTDIRIRVATSIRIDKQLSRNKGSDAIRVYAILYKERGDVQGLSKHKRVNRTVGWKSNLEKAVIEIIEKAKWVYNKHHKMGV